MPTKALGLTYPGLIKTAASLLRVWSFSSMRGLTSPRGSAQLTYGGASFSQRCVPPRSPSHVLAAAAVAGVMSQRSGSRVRGLLADGWSSSLSSFSTHHLSTCYPSMEAADAFSWHLRLRCRDDRARTAHAWAAALGQRSAARLIDTLAAHPNPTVCCSFRTVCCCFQIGCCSLLLAPCKPRQRAARGSWFLANPNSILLLACFSLLADSV